MENGAVAIRARWPWKYQSQKHRNLWEQETIEKLNAQARYVRALSRDLFGLKSFRNYGVSGKRDGGNSSDLHHVIEVSVERSRRGPGSPNGAETAPKRHYSVVYKLRGARSYRR
jgi:hypothetical protein